MEVHPQRLAWIAKRLALVVGVFALVLVIIGAVQYRKKSIVAQDGLIIDVVNNTANNDFIAAQDVRDILFKNFKHDIVGQPLELIDIEEIERVLEKSIFIKNAEIYIDALNKVHITIEQRIPIVRIMDLEEPSYYLDEEGTWVETSSKFTARVLVVTGNVGRYNANYKTIPHNRLRKILKLAQFIDKNPFWKAQIEQVNINNSGDATLIPKLGDQKIKFGDPEEKIADKFYRLKVFMEEGLPVEGWEKYRTIDLSFEKQVVAKKR